MLRRYIYLRNKAVFYAGVIMKYTFSISDKMDSILNELTDDPELDFKTKVEVIRKSLLVYSYLVKKHRKDYKIIGQKEDGTMEDLSSLFEII